MHKKIILFPVSSFLMFPSFLVSFFHDKTSPAFNKLNLLSREGSVCVCVNMGRSYLTFFVLLCLSLYTMINATLL